MKEFTKALLSRKFTPKNKMNTRLVSFIKEARKKGYEDWQIREPLLRKGWAEDEVEEAFESLKSTGHKSKVCVYLDDEAIKMLEKRAKKNMFTLPEQIEDVLRRSCLSFKKEKLPKENIDDMLVSLFSRRKYGKK